MLDGAFFPVHEDIDQGIHHGIRVCYPHGGHRYRMADVWKCGEVDDAVWRPAEYCGKDQHGSCIIMEETDRGEFVKG